MSDLDDTPSIPCMFCDIWASMKVAVFWAGTLRSLLEIYRRFGETLMLEGVCSSETSSRCSLSLRHRSRGCRTFWKARAGIVEKFGRNSLARRNMRLRTGTVFQIIPATSWRTGQLTRLARSCSEYFWFPNSFIFIKRRGFFIYFCKRRFLGLLCIVTKNSCPLPYVCILHLTAVHPENAFSLFKM